MNKIKTKNLENVTSKGMNEEKLQVAEDQELDDCLLEIVRLHGLEDKTKFDDLWVLICTSYNKATGESV